MKVKVLFTFALIMLAVLSANAQKENYNWLFGDNRGLTWLTTQSYTATDVFGISGGDITLTGVPTVIPSSIRTTEGCFSVSNSRGELLFYSNGITVWDKNGTVMPNALSSSAGGTLTGHSSSAQSGIVIPYPGKDTDKYIAFTLGERDNDNMSYSVIDMKLRSGLGDVVKEQKNIQLTGAAGILGESMTAVRHPNKTDFWIIAVGRETDNTYLNVWKVDQQGVHLDAISSYTLNFVNYPTMPGGYLRFTKDGTRFFYSNYAYNPGYFVYGTFDPSLGTFTSIKKKSRPTVPSSTTRLDGGYGVEFSPSGKYVYATRINGSYGAPNASYPYLSPSYLYVYDFEQLLAADDLNTIAPLANIESPKTYITQDGTNKHFGAVLLGPDNRIYIRDAYSNSIFVVPEPDNDPTNLKIYRLKGVLEGNEVSGSSGLGGFGLPTYTAFWFNVNLVIPVDPSAPPCEGVPTPARLDISGGEGGDDFSSVKIDWGDESVITENNSPQVGTSYDYTHTYARAGTYTVTVNCYDSSGILMPSLSYTKSVVVGTCKLPVNPHVRSWLKK